MRSTEGDGPARGNDVVASWSPAAIETHISVLFLVGDRAYKVKKPVHLSILDWRQRTDREAACHREVELNRRLSPDVHLGVIDIIEDGRAIDHAVVMRRMPPERRLRRLLAEGAELTEALRDLADLLARFHAGAVRSPAIDAQATVHAVARRWLDNLSVLRRHVGDSSSDPTAIDGAVVDHLALSSGRFLAGRRPLFESRIAAGNIVDGHGDLMAEDIFLLDDGPRVLDCIEFSDELRAVDVLDDACILAMDLERFGSAAIAESFLHDWRRALGVEHPSSLAHHWIAYRAVVRAVVGCLRAEQGLSHAPDDIVESRGLLDLACRHLHDGRVRLVLVGGLPGAGKSTVANAIGSATGWPVLHSDLVRKELLDLAPERSAVAALGADAYSHDTTMRTYDALLDRAHSALGMGESIVLDATWHDPSMRERAEKVADATSSDLLVLECAAPMDLCLDRLIGRTDAVGSDATADVAEAMAARSVPWAIARRLDTSGPLDATVNAALAAVA